MTCKTFCNSRKRTQKGKRQNVCLLFRELFSQRNSQASFTLKVCTLIQKVKKSRKCQILSAHSSERRVSMQRRNILGKMPDLQEVPIQRGFKGIMCTLVSIKECIALLSISPGIKRIAQHDTQLSTSPSHSEDFLRDYSRAYVSIANHPFTMS